MSDKIDYSCVRGEKALLSTLMAADARNAELQARIDRLEESLAVLGAEFDRLHAENERLKYEQSGGA